MRKSLWIIYWIGFCLWNCQEKSYLSTDPQLQMISGVMLYGNSLLKGNIISEIPALEETHYTSFDNGIQHGEFKVIHKSGLVIQKTIFKNGKQEGISRTWFLNGKNKSLSEFHNGNYINERMEWYDNGNLALYEKFDENGKILVNKKFYREGKIYMNVVFKNDGSSFGLPGSKICNPISSSNRFQFKNVP